MHADVQACVYVYVYLYWCVCVCHQSLSLFSFYTLYSLFPFLLYFFLITFPIFSFFTTKKGAKGNDNKETMRKEGIKAKTKETRSEAEK